MRAILFGLLLAGCGGKLDRPERFQPGACADTETTIFQPRCATAGCHSGAAPEADLDFGTAGVGKRMLDKTSATCGGKKLIDSATPSASLLLEKIAPSPSCGVQMPLTGNYLSDAERSCVAQWVQGVIAGGP